MRLQQILHLDDGEFVEARAAEEAKPTTAPPVSRPLGWGRAMLNHLAVEAPVDRTLGLRRPVAPLPRPMLALDTIAYLAAVSTAIHADYKRHLDTLRVLDDISAALTEHPELLTTDGHPGPRLLLRRIAAELAPHAADWNTMVPEKRGDTAKAGASL